MLDDQGIEMDDRMMNADVTAPIIITPWEGKWVIIDGLHRVGKAMLSGLSTIPAKIIHAPILNMARI